MDSAYATAKRCAENAINCLLLDTGCWGKTVRLSPASTFSDSLAKPSFFKTDSGRLHFRGKATRFESTLSRFNARLGAIDIDVFCLFGHLGEDRHLLRCHFRVTPEHRHILHLLADSIPKFTDFQRGKKMGMAGKHAEFTFDAWRYYFFDLLTEQQMFRRDDL